MEEGDPIYEEIKRKINKQDLYLIRRQIDIIERIRSLSLLIKTTALSSNRICIPLSRLKPFDVRTITAFKTSDFLTEKLGNASRILKHLIN